MFTINEATAGETPATSDGSVELDTHAQILQRFAWKNNDRWIDRCFFFIIQKNCTLDQGIYVQLMNKTRVQAFCLFHEDSSVAAQTEEEHSEHRELCCLTRPLCSFISDTVEYELSVLHLLF